MKFAEFMASTVGRAIRVIAGLILIGVGLGIMEGTTRIVLIIVGFVPLLAGVFDVCLFAPLLGASGGADVRK